MEKAFLKLTIAALVIFSNFGLVRAAGVDMGTGVPVFGFYSTAVTASPTVHVWALESPQYAFPTTCSYLILRSSYMGLESFKIAVGIMTSARLANRAVQFYSHYDASGCLVDYVRLL
jgi:hypothetical protein